MRKETDTYVIEHPDRNAYSLLNNGKIERENNGDIIRYSKYHLIQDVKKLLNDNRIEKGEKVENQSKGYNIYIFNYEAVDINQKPIKYALRIKVSTKYEANKEYMEQLDDVVQATYKVTSTNPNIKLLLTAGVTTALVISGLIYGGQKIIEVHNNDKIVYEETSQYRDLVYDNTHRTGNNNEYYYYDTGDIASSISKDEDKDKAIFGVYKNIGYNNENKKQQMNDVISNVDFSNDEDNKGKAFEKFNDYVIAEGFVNSEGKADYDAYAKAMAKKIIDERNLEKLEQEVERSKSK